MAPRTISNALTWICLVDDQLEVRDVLCDVLRTAGYGVQSFRDGSDALEAIDSALEGPRLLILDLVLPHMSGQEVLQRVRRGKRVPNVPVVIITGLDVEESELAPFHIAGILRKPIAVEALLTAVAGALPRRRRPR